jgi:hypothetical protein
MLERMETMIITKILPVVFFIVFASGALAQIDPDPDGIGIYFDLEATQVSATVEVGEALTGYLIATNPSQEGGLATWEADVYSTVVEVFIWGEPVNGTNVATNMPPGGPGFSFVVSQHMPLPPLQSITLLGTLWITVMADGPIGLEVHGGWGQECPMYGVDEFDYPDHCLFPSSGNVDLPVAVINGPAPVATEPLLWGQVKSLFR